MSSILRSALVCGFILALSGQANASSGGAVHQEFLNPQEQVVLTSESVEKVIKVLPELLALSKTYQGKHSVGPDKKVKNTKYDAFTIALTALSGEHGFKDMKTMQSTVETTMLTAGFIKSGKTLAQVDKEIKATQKRVQSDKKTDVKQKSSLLRRMHIQVSMVVPTSANLKTVKPFFPRIEAITGKKK